MASRQWGTDRHEGYRIVPVRHVGSRCSYEVAYRDYQQDQPSSNREVFYLDAEVPKQQIPADEK